MLYQQKFLKIIKAPYDLDEQSLAVLEKLASDYPYCQSLQILLAKNLQEHDKLAFEKQVNKASAYAIDRRKFQRYISDRDKPRPEEDKTDSISSLKDAKTDTVEPAADAFTESETPEILSEEHLIKAESFRKEKESTDLSDESPVEKALNDTPGQEYNEDMQVAEEAEKPADDQHESEFSEKEEDQHGIGSTEKKEQTYSLLEIVKRRLKEIRDRNKTNQGKTEKAEEHSETISPSEDGKTDEPDAKESALNAERMNETSDSVSKEEDLPAATPDDNSPDDNANDRVEDSLQPELPDEGSPKEDPSIEKEESVPPMPDRGFTPHEKQAQKPDISYLIDKFLKEEPRIQVSKNLPDKQEDLSASSTNEDPQLVTETLAKIYLGQGKKDKALDIYEKLCLKFPEKSSYFAKKILDIKKEINI